MLKVDHVLIAARNHYDCAARLREETGLDSFEGGWFPDEGLAQKLVPLGNDQYIEIEGVVDLDVVEDPDGPLEAGRYVVDAVANGDAFAGWWVLTDDLDGVCRRLGTPVYTVNKRLPDGSPRSGRGTPPSLDALRRGLPMFWTVDDWSTHAGRRPVDHRTEPRGITWLEVGGDERVLRDWLGDEADQLPLRYVGGDPGLHAIAIEFEEGEIVLRPSGKQLSE
jgi:hypothetical protein